MSGWSCKESPECAYVATCPDCSGCDDCCDCESYCYACTLERPCECDRDDDMHLEGGDD
jgi:hypothetical protein